MAEAGRVHGISKARLDALTDGVFAFAMTLLVISLDLPDSAAIASPGDLLAALAKLQDNLLVYVISFFVLGARWLRSAAGHGSEIWCGYGYARAVIVHLFFVTLIPFSTKLVGLYGDYWPAICLYAANTILGALASLLAAERLAVEEKVAKPDGRLDVAVLVASALVSCALAFVAPRDSMYAYLLNFATPLLHRLLRKA